MNLHRDRSCKFLAGVVLQIITAHWFSGPACAAPASAETNDILLIDLAGQGQVMSSGSAKWVACQTNQSLSAFDHFRTLKDSRATLRWSDNSQIRLAALTEIEILPPHSAKAESGLHILQGIFSFFHRDTPGRIRIVTQGAVAGIEGTEFVLAVDSTNGQELTTVSVIDGKVSLNGTNSSIGATLTNGEQAVVIDGNQPVRTAGFVANNLLQWCLWLLRQCLICANWNLVRGGIKDAGRFMAAYRCGNLPRRPYQIPRHSGIRIRRGPGFTMRRCFCRWDRWTNRATCSPNFRREMTLTRLLRLADAQRIPGRSGQAPA